MPQIELSSGPIDYLDSGGNGPVLVLSHGLPMDGLQWRKVVPLLDGYRCIRPTLPLGAHRHPMRSDADLTQRGVALLLAEFLEALDLREVTVVLNDWGGGQFMISEGRAGRLARLVLVACEAFDNFPPGAARALSAVIGIPGVARLFFALHGLEWPWRIPGGYGSMSLSTVPHEVRDAWFGPGRRQAAVRRDFVKFARGAPDRRTLLDWSERLRTFDRPVLVVWAKQDQMMPAEHGRRLAELYPNSRLVEIDDSATLVPEDQPELLARTLREFLTETGAPAQNPADDATGQK